jgi:uncharacterized membrane protein
LWASEVAAIGRQLARPEILTTAVVVYTIVIVLWFLVIELGVRLEPVADERFVRISGWPTRPAIVGLIWTALLLAATVAALRGPGALGAWCLSAMTACALALWVFIPPWFRRMGVIGLSTSEFTDAFLMAGGILPGGQGTLFLTGVCVVLASLTVFRALFR